MKKISFKNSSVIIFIIIAIFYAIGNFIWWKLNTPVIPQGICALHFLDIFKNSWLYYNAPLITWIMKGFFSIFGKEYFDLQIIFVNYMFFLIALFFIYKIGRELKDKETGNIAMILFAATPAVYGLSRQYGHQEYHVMIAMIVNIYCLIKLNDFKDRKWSVLYGITVGLGLLIKDEFLPYFFMPWLYVVIRSLMDKTDKNKIINVIITIAVGSLIAGGHYFRLEIISKILNDPFVEKFNSDILNFETSRITTLGLSEYLLSPPIFILFLLGLFYFIFRFKNKNKFIMLIWIIVPWTIITFMPHHKLPEYEIGFIPAIILIISIYIGNIKIFYRKQLLIILVSLICILQYIDFSYIKKICNLNLKYKHYKIYYFDMEEQDNVYDGNFMVYKKNLKIISLVNYLKNNFTNKSIFLYKFIGTTEPTIAYLEVKDLNNISLYKEDMDTNDIIVDIEEYSVLNEKYLFKMEKLCYDDHNIDVNLEELKKYISEKITNIRNNYIQIDEFYLDENNKKTENHVYILGKKELFEGKGNIIKHPYKIQEY